MSFCWQAGHGLLVAVTMGTVAVCVLFFRADCVFSHLSSHFPALSFPLPLPLAFPSPLSFSPRCRFAAVGVFLVGPVGASCAASGCFLSDLSVCLVPFALVLLFAAGGSEHTRRGGRVAFTLGGGASKA